MKDSRRLKFRVSVQYGARYIPKSIDRSETWNAQELMNRDSTLQIIRVKICTAADTAQVVPITMKKDHL